MSGHARTRLHDAFSLGKRRENINLTFELAIGQLLTPLIMGVFRPFFEAVRWRRAELPCPPRVGVTKNLENGLADNIENDWLPRGENRCRKIQEAAGEPTPLQRSRGNPKRKHRIEPP